MDEESKIRTRIRETTTALRRLRDVCIINVNQVFHREYIPWITESLCIEPTSICNLSCRFCAYGKKQSPKCVMPYERFCEYVDQAVGLGYSRFTLTPLTGEVFVDRGLFDKLAYLERHPKVIAYSFFSNFTLPDRGAIERLFDLRKLQRLTVSLYGHDRDSFMAFTRAGEKVYERLVANLQMLEEKIASRRFAFEVGWRTSQGRHGGRGRDSEVTAILGRLRTVHGIRIHISREYNNWGGLVRPEDLEGLNVHVRGPRAIYKKGACTLIFSRMLVTADGRMNACACRDVDGTLCIGDLKEQSLCEILSTQNERYMQLIEAQQQGRFGRICQDCDLYKSIYRRRSVYRSHEVKPIDLAQFYREIRRRAASRDAQG